MVEAIEKEGKNHQMIITVRMAIEQTPILANGFKTY